MSDYFNITLPEQELSSISMLGLAHIGDAVYELMVRSWLVCHGKLTSRTLHRATVELVRAGAQARFAARIAPTLTDGESAIYRRGRNTRVNSVPKGAQISEYHAATGFEALFGWLYLRGEHDRLSELFAMIMEEENHAS